MAIKSKPSFDPKSFLAKVGDGRSAKPARRVANLSECNDAACFGVNEQFACDLHKLLRRDDMIWVHDYHFIPVAHFLRQTGWVNRIGFFLHIPWPGPDVASALPAYKWILRSFGAYDVVGFQTEADANNFRDCIVAANA